MSNKLTKEVKEVREDSRFKKFITNKKVSIPLAILILVGGGIGIGVASNNAYYRHLMEKEANAVGLDGKGTFFDDKLNYIVTFPEGWGYATEDEEVITTAIKESGVKNQAFDLDRHSLKYEVTPLVFAKEEGNENSYRSFMSVSFRGFFGNELYDAKQLLKDELVAILEKNGHNTITFKKDTIEDNGGSPTVFFDVETTAPDNPNEVVHYTQRSKLVGKNLCTVILGTTDKNLARDNMTLDLLVSVTRTDPQFMYTQESSKEEKDDIPKIELGGEGTQSIPVEGGTLEIINGVDVDIDKLKETDGVTVKDIPTQNSSESEVKENE